MDAACLKHVIMEWPENSHRTLGRDHPDCWVVRVMPHPSPHIWVHPCDWSLQPLYLFTLFYNLYTLLQIYKCEDYATFVSCHLRGPPPPTPLHAPLPPPPLVTLAHAGSDVLGSGHQLWCWNPTTGHRRQDVPPLPWSTSNLMIIVIYLFPALLPLHPARAPRL